MINDSKQADLGREDRMPIPREQFDKELDQTEYKILEFLKQHPREAYQCHEVAEGIGEWHPPESTGKRILYAIGTALSVGGTLDQLAKKNLVDKKTIDGTSWYSIHK